MPDPQEQYIFQLQKNVKMNFASKGLGCQADGAS